MLNNGLLSRFLYSIIFVFISSLIRPVVIVLMIIQYLYVIIKSEKQQTILSLGHSLAQYSYEITSFLTFNTEQVPFPFSEWPN